MKTLFGGSILFSLATTLEAAGFHLLVYNPAGLPNETLVQAVEETARIFARGGIRMSWAHCAPYLPEGPAQSAPCRPAPDVPEFFLKLAAESKARVLGHHRLVHGFAVFSEEGKPGNTAFVFPSRAMYLTKGMGVSFGSVLGCLIAHELGHLLLGMRGHSTTGMMHVPWETEELQWISRGAMVFHTKELERISARLGELLQNRLN